MQYLVSTILSAYTGLLILQYAQGFRRRNWLPKSPNFSLHEPSITILITSRFPSAKLINLIVLLRKQVVRPQVDILVINDHSDFSFDWTQLGVPVISLSKVLPTSSYLDNNKKLAIQYAAEHLASDYIVCLDDDVIPVDTWFKTMYQFILDFQPAFVAGIYRALPQSTLLSRFISIEQDVLTGISIASYQLKYPTMCNGANMIFRRDVFLMVGGYKSKMHALGGDDMFLYHCMYRLLPDHVYYLPDRGAAVYGLAADTWSTMLRQKARWLDKSFDYDSIWTTTQLLLVALGQCFFCIVIYGGLFDMYPFVFFVMIIPNIILLVYFSKFYSWKNSFFSILALLFLYPPYTIIVSIYSAASWFLRRINKLMSSKSI